MILLVVVAALGGAALGAVLAWVSAARAAAARAEVGRRAVEAARVEADAASRRHRALLDAFPQALLLYDPLGRLQAANRAGERYVRPRHGDALVQAEIHELVTAVRRGIDRGAVVGDGRVERVPEASVRRLDLAGPPRQVVVLSARRLADGSGNVLVIVEDVTERRRLEEMRRDFVANISHELRTPVGALSLLAETIAGEDDPDLVARLSGRLHAEAHRLARMVDELLLLASIEGGLGEARPVRVGDVVAGALERTAAAAAARGIDVRVVRAAQVVGADDDAGNGETGRPGERTADGDLGGAPASGGVADVDLDAELPGDRAQLVSALANLVDNAITYSDQGSVVRLAVTATGSWVELSVSDHGIGIPARDLERVFERFYRVDRARSRRTGGTGLGLAIVRHVVTNHGGQVTVRSREGEGSTFTLRLPLGPDPEDSEHEGPEREGSDPAGCDPAGPDPAGSDHELQSPGVGPAGQRAVRLGAAASVGAVASGAGRR